MPAHSAVSIETAGGTSPHVLVSTSSFLAPPRTDSFSSSGKVATLREGQQLFDPKRFVVEQRFAPAKDGAKIPYYLIRPAGLPMDGSTPTLIHAYGAFSVATTPAYIAGSGKIGFGFPMLDRGGAFVVANVRGGGEYGPAWHEAGMLSRKQNTFDDVAAVAEDLIRAKISSPAHLGFIGISAGGLVATAVGTRYPGLFSAVISESATTDMLRYAQLSMGRIWAGEYGDPQDPQAHRYLQSYSPFHNVREDRSYPQMLVLASTGDTTVHTGGHSRRFAERLRSLGKPVLYYEPAQGGHNLADNMPLQAGAEFKAMEAVYLFQKLGVR